MSIVDDLYYWTDLVIFFGLLALKVWALVDCATRKTAAFPAVEKLTKPAWLVILLVAGFLGTYFGQPTSPFAVLGIFPLVSVVVAAIYLADVRPAVREISDGR